MRRLTEILAAEAATTAGTKTIDINISDLISRISIQFKGTNNGSTPTAHPAKMISKIELVDGSDVLYSLSGTEAQALNFYEGQDLPINVLDFRNDVMAIAVYHINLGRWLYDPKLALDPQRFSNLQLKITHNKASGGSAPDAGELSVFANVMERSDATPTGFLMSKEIQSYALVSSAHEYIQLPTDYTYRRLIIASLAAAKQPWEQFNKLKLHIDNEKVVLLNNISTSQLLKLYAPKNRILEAIVGTGTGSEVTYYVSPSFEMYVAVTGLAATQTILYATQGYGGAIAIDNDNAESFQALVHGLAPHGALDLPFGTLDDIETFLQTQKIGSLKLDITAGSSVGASSTCEIISQQVRTYK